MLIQRLLDYDLHSSKKGLEVNPYWVETPSLPHFVPAIISSATSGKFLVARRMTNDNHIRSGCFDHDSDNIDELINPLFFSAYRLSVEEKFPNIFTSAIDAFKYIADQSSTGAHPHILLIPSSWGPEEISRNFSSDDLSDSNVFRKICRMIPADVHIPIFFSRPDFVGMHTRFTSGRSSILLHNVKNGLAFVIPKV